MPYGNFYFVKFSFPVTWKQHKTNGETNLEYMVRFRLDSEEIYFNVHKILKGSFITFKIRLKFQI